MPHGLTYFNAQELVDKAQGALKLIDSTLESGQDASFEATQETLRVVIENQMRIAETLDLIKQEFDKFEEGLGKIL